MIRYLHPTVLFGYQLNTVYLSFCDNVLQINELFQCFETKIQHVFLEQGPRKKLADRVRAYHNHVASFDMAIGKHVFGHSLAVDKIINFSTNAMR